MAVGMVKNASIQKTDSTLKKFLGHLKCSNHPGYEAQSCSTQKVGFSKWCLFFDSICLRPCPLPSGGYIQKIPNRQGFHLTRVN